MPVSTEIAADERPVPWAPIAATTAMMGVFAVTLGLTYPLLSLVLESQGEKSAMIGLNAAMAPLGLVASAPIMPMLARRFGPWPMAVACAVATGTLMIALGAFRALEPWFPLRFLLGIAISGLFIVSETWINQLATRRIRGRVMGIYTMVLSGGFAVGPFLIAAIGSAGWLPFLVGAGIAFSILPFLWAVRRRVPQFEPEERSSLMAFLPMAPALMAVVGVMALFDAAGLALLPVYGLRHGLDEATTSTAVGMLVIGNVLFQYPIGWLADHMSRRWLLLGLAILTIAGCLALPAAIETPALRWPLLLFWGAMAFGVYPVALAELGDRFSGALLLAGNAAFALMWGVGGLIGAPIAGAAMQAFGPEGLPVTLALAYAGLVVVAVLRRD